jgi:xylulokinase
MNEAEACATGMWVHGATPSVVSNSGQGSVQGYWDEGVLDIVGGSREEGRRVRGWLGDVDVSGGGRRAGSVSRYLVERYGFDPGRSTTLKWSVPANIFDVRYHCDTIHVRFPFFLPIAMSLCERCSFILWTHGYLAYPSTTLYPYKTVQYIPSPRPRPRGKKEIHCRIIQSVCYNPVALGPNLIGECRNGDVPRALVRDMYTKSWSAFDRLVAIVPPGGSIGYVLVSAHQYPALTKP